MNGRTAPGEAMNERDAFDAVLAALHEAAFDDSRWPAASGLVDEACGIKGNLLTHGAGTTPDDHVVYLHRICFRGERWPDAEAAYFEEYFAEDERVPRLRALPDSRRRMPPSSSPTRRGRPRRSGTRRCRSSGCRTG